MDWQYLALLALPLFVLLFFYRRRARPQAPEFPYVRRTAMFSPAERSFLRLLDIALGTDYRIFAKVRVADVLFVPAGGDKSVRLRAFVRIASKHFDYVLCYRHDLRPVCAINLNDPSRTGGEGRSPSAFLTRACRVARFPLIDFDAHGSYSPAAIRQTVLNALGTSLPFAPLVSVPDAPVVLSTGTPSEMPEDECGAPLPEQAGRSASA